MGGLGSTRWDGHRRHRTVEETTNALHVREARVVVQRLDAESRDDGLVRLARAPTRRAMVRRLATNRWELLVCNDWTRNADAVIVERREHPETVTWLLRCPYCQAPCRTLYEATADSDLSCRSCSRLTYTSQRLAPHDRATFLSKRLASKLGTEWSPMGSKIPRRRRGLRRRTFATWRRLLAGHMEQRDSIWMHQALKFLRRRPPHGMTARNRTTR